MRLNSLPYGGQLMPHLLDWTVCGVRWRAVACGDCCASHFLMQPGQGIFCDMAMLTEFGNKFHRFLVHQKLIEKFFMKWSAFN